MNKRRSAMNKRRDAGFVVRRANAGDVQAIGRVHVETWRSTYAGLLPDDLLVGMSLEKQSQMWQRMLRGGETVIVDVTADLNVNLAAEVTSGGTPLPALSPIGQGVPSPRWFSMR